MMLLVNKQAIAKAFDRAAINYDNYASLQRFSGDALLELAPACSGRIVLDAGCGTGWYSRIWRNRGKYVIALDLSLEMLKQAKIKNSANYYVSGDIDYLPIANGTLDIVWSNLAVQWSSDLSTVLNRFNQALKPSGYMLFSTISDGSLKELNIAWSYLDQYNHVNQFLSRKEIFKICHMQNIICHSQVVIMHFPTVLSAMRSLKGIGATHVHKGRNIIVLTRNNLDKLGKYWPRDKYGFRLSYNLIYGVTDL
ncbi:malonyl-[acyl-carrier protein] O-methyltransferase BioC [Candidatus Pantoea edessiphila]|uniref:Malonyl-[acyl-carrier protein] O-methyltransferase n=1 Tax=Candidatus Pantoea edessiphila TaxID=2044610 RepID=A0A2P5SYY8_9GAMM|nr:malonyl-ACP O-methyltransferase BioC [Candidatus Pantoea edessiphila]MBK4775309.1 malonyl-ACP O-methyltransferase BioC [Pantoea sp. Edef]PPI87554.1 malonyl-[acyl-carrier protein] O-methyltransferase BioC [Candidatus Pantoea edessiphila]